MTLNNPVNNAYFGRMEVSPVSFEEKDLYLSVVGHGQRDSLASMIEASELIFEKLKQTGSRFVLLDYTNMAINVHLNEAFNIVKRYEMMHPDMRTIVVAAAFNSAGMEFGNYWKEIAKKRGFSVEIFEEIDVAESWLKEKIRS